MHRLLVVGLQLALVASICLSAARVGNVAAVVDPRSITAFTSKSDGAYKKEGVRPGPIQLILSAGLDPFEPSGRFATPLWPIVGFGRPAVLAPANSGELLLLRSSLYRGNTEFLWHVLPDLGDYTQKTTLAISPDFASDRTVMVGLRTGADTIRLSFDGGDTWESPDQPVLVPIKEIVVSPAFLFDETAFAVAQPGAGPAMRTTDGGQHWNPISMPPHPVGISRLTLSPYYLNDKTLFAVMLDGTVWRSTNAGQAWVRADTSLGTQSGNPVNAIALAPLGAGYMAMVAAAHLAVVISFDLGDTWYLIDWKNFGDISVAPDFGQSLTIYGVVPGSEHIPGSQHVLRSDDLGQTWWQPLPDEDVTQIAFSPRYAQDGTLYFVTADILWRSINRGHTWQEASGRQPHASDTFVTLLLSPNFDNDATMAAVLLFQTFTPRFAYTTDGGRTWSMPAMPPGLSGHFPVLAFSPKYAADRKLFIARERQLYVTTNLGMEWIEISASLPIDVGLLVVSPGFATDQTLFIASNGGGVYRSVNGGQSWSPISSGVPAQVTDLQVSPGYPADPSVYVVADNGIYRTSNGGASWTEMTAPAGVAGYQLRLSPKFAQDQSIFALVDSEETKGVFLSHDGGETWSDISAEAWDGRRVAALAVSPAYASDRTMAAMVVQDGVYLSEDAGTTWYKLDGMRAGETYHWFFNVALVYSEGRLTPVATVNSELYTYVWPLLAPTPSPILVALEPGTTGIVNVPLVLGAGEAGPGRTAWQITGGSDWLTVEPVSGTLPADIVFSINADQVTGGATTDLTLRRYLSYQQVETKVIRVRAFWISGRAWMLVIQKNPNFSVWRVAEMQSAVEMLIERLQPFQRE